LTQVSLPLNTVSWGLLVASSVALTGEAEKGQLPIFPGVDKVVDLVGKLCRRPRFDDDPAAGRWSRRTRRGLPMVCPSSPAQYAGLLGGLAARLSEAQPSRAPHCRVLPGGFLGLAERLTGGADGWRQENATQVARLLTNSFLEDLRRAWHWPWRPGGPRRMTYAVMQLDDIAAGNGGFGLLRLTNHVRSEVGLFDPLLVITAGERVPHDTDTQADQEYGENPNRAHMTVVDLQALTPPLPVPGRSGSRLTGRCHRHWESRCTW